jgi:hypothetical protein
MDVSQLAADLLETFAISFGVVVGGAFLAALAALISGGYPADTLLLAADRLKVWGAAAAMGGSLVNLRRIETGILRWQLHLLLRELVSLGLAFAGGVVAYALLSLLVGNGP